MYSQTNNHPPENIFQEYLDNELTTPNRRILEEHLKTCQRCKGTLNSLENLYSQIKEMPEKKLSKDLSSVIISKIESQSNINVSFPRWVVFTQVLVAVIMVVTSISYLPIDFDFSTLSRIQFNWFTNIQHFSNSISSELNNLYHSILEVEFIFRTPSFFSLSNILSSDYLLLLTISAGLLWLVGNRILLSNFKQEVINGG